MVIDTNGLFIDLTKQFKVELEVVESLSVVSDDIEELKGMLENFEQIENADFSVKNVIEEDDLEADEDDFEEDDFDESELDELDEEDLEALEDLDEDDLEEDDFEDFDAKSVPEYLSIEKIMEMV